MYLTKLKNKMVWMKSQHFRFLFSSTQHQEKVQNKLSYYPKEDEINAHIVAAIVQKQKRNEAQYQFHLETGEGELKILPKRRKEMSVRLLIIWNIGESWLEPSLSNYRIAIRLINFRKSHLNFNRNTND